MKKLFLPLLCLLLLAGCAAQPPLPEDASEEDSPAAEIPAADALPEADAPSHSPLYIEGVTAENAVLWFEEVCLDAEFTSGGSAQLVQKWDAPILYRVFGSPTEVDLQTLEAFVLQANSIKSFPGMRKAAEDETYSLAIHFCTGDELAMHLGSQFSTLDYGGCTFWYDEDNVIYQGIICCRSDIEQSQRCSVIPEELYNALGPVQDTLLRPDSLIYQYSNETQRMTAEDRLMLQLLYHRHIRPGMTAEECETVIREIYY